MSNLTNAQLVSLRSLKTVAAYAGVTHIGAAMPMYNSDHEVPYSIEMELASGNGGTTPHTFLLDPGGCIAEILM